MGRLDRMNYSNPLQGRKWLRRLRPDPVSGLRIEPNLRLRRRELGFSFRTNGLGLRGPDDPNAANVILGTSFAMGFAVDDGDNWYERAGLAAPGWINLSLPVGMEQLEALLGAHYRGACETLLFVYHPNIWPFTLNFAQAAASGRSIFEAMGWTVDLRACLELYLRRRLAKPAALRAGTLIEFRHGRRRYAVEAGYNRFDFGAQPAVVERTVASLGRMFARFRRVLVARAIIKQECVPAEFENPRLAETRANYERGWGLLRERLAGRATFHAPRGFTMADFYPRDTHWNAAGNARFAEFVRGLLAGKE